MAMCRHLKRHLAALSTFPSATMFRRVNWDGVRLHPNRCRPDFALLHSTAMDDHDGSDACLRRHEEGDAFPWQITSLVGIALDGSSPSIQPGIRHTGASVRRRGAAGVDARRTSQRKKRQRNSRREKLPPTTPPKLTLDITRVIHDRP